MSAAQARTKIALALDLIKEASDLITDESAAYHALRSMEESGHHVYHVLNQEEIEEQANLLTNFRSMTA